MTKVLSSLSFPLRSPWVSAVDAIDRETVSTAALWRRLVQGRRYDVVVLDGAVGRRQGYVDRLAAAQLSWGEAGPRVIITDATWAPSRWPAGHALQRWFVNMHDSPRTTYCVLSSEELKTFPEIWGVDPSRVVHTPFYWTVDDSRATATQGDGSVFAGGDSLRDYGTLLSALQRLRGASATLATSWQPSTPPPPGVRIGRVNPSDFFDLMASSSVVVVPLAPNMLRSAGQQTYLNAMVMGKAVIVTDSPGVRDIVEDGRTGYVVPAGDPGALAEALQALTGPENLERAWEIGQQAHAAVVEKYSPDAYVRTLLRVVNGEHRDSPP